MGNFINTNYNDTVNSLVEGAKKRLNNPYYIHNDRKPITVTYYNVDPKASTYDPGTLDSYDQTGNNSSFRYNKIEEFHLYGIDPVQLNMSIGEFGIESPVEGEAIILPNTIVPMVGDMFIIDHILETPLVFGVNSINMDTLTNGANFYKITYHLSRNDDGIIETLDEQSKKTFAYKPGNVGTNFSPILIKEDSLLIDKVEEYNYTLRKYYMDLFFKQNVQTFILPYNDYLLYDPYLINFIIKNDLYNLGGNEYVHISPAVYTGSTFNIEYDHTIFRDIENRVADLHLNSLYPTEIHDPNSLLINRLETFYYLSIKTAYRNIDLPINWLDMDFQDRIMNNQLYTIDEPKLYYRNIIIGYLNDKNFEVNDNMFKSLSKLDYDFTKQFFYELPILIFILKKYTENKQERVEKIDTESTRGNNDESIISEKNFTTMR